MNITRISSFSAIAKRLCECYFFNDMNVENNDLHRLTDEKFWDRFWSQTIYGKNKDQVKGSRMKNAVKNLLHRLLGERVWDRTRNYSEYVLWERLFPRFLPPFKGKKILEIGSAPGVNLVRFHRDFGLDVYGVEYTAAGTEINRRVFRENGLPPDHVVQADLFSPDYQKMNREGFDIVFSAGLLEHFQNTSPVIDAHLSLLKKNGLLVVVIPNFTGIYHAWARLFNRGLLDSHNLSIMKSDRFRQLFDRMDLHPLYCGYYGSFDFSLFGLSSDSRFRVVTTLFNALQRVVNLACRSFFPNGGIAGGWVSPFLIYVGERTGAGNKT